MFIGPLAPPLGELPKAEGVSLLLWYRPKFCNANVGEVVVGARFHPTNGTPSAPVCALGQLPQRGSQGCTKQHFTKAWLLPAPFDAGSGGGYTRNGIFSYSSLVTTSTTVLAMLLNTL